MLFKNKSNIDYIIVGLGNPGLQYENTRHNAGFMAIDTIAKANGFTLDKEKFHAKFAKVKFDDKECIFLKPQTYMNDSGISVSEAMNFYKVPLKNVIVIFDDISLEPGNMRIRRNGSAGGHNGIKSIIGLCGGDNFQRIKIGVGKKPNPQYDLASWVLSKFKEDDLKALNPILENSEKALRLIVEENVDKAMNLYNS